MDQKREFEDAEMASMKRAKLAGVGGGRSAEGETGVGGAAGARAPAGTNGTNGTLPPLGAEDALARVADLAGEGEVKPEHGSDEWHKIRKMNHKEVERRRRETINEAIKDLQELVPTAHNNKAQVIRKAADAIRKYKEQEEVNVNKWTLEKIITDQAIAELASSNEKLKTELEKAYREIEHHKSQFGKFIEVVKANGVNPAITEFLSKVQVVSEEKPKEDDDEDSRDNE